MEQKAQNLHQNDKPFASKVLSVQLDIYRDGTRVTVVPSGFKSARIEVTETADYRLSVRYA